MTPVRSPAAPAPVSAPTTTVGADDTSAEGCVADGLVVVVAPVNGRFHPGTCAGPVRAGAVLGTIATGGGGQTEVRTPVAAVIQGVMIRAGQLVTAGHALAWGVRAEPAA